MDQDYLSHHGIKGQKHGVRKYQYPDGSLTPEGRLRYLKNAASKFASKTMKDISASNKKRAEKNRIRKTENDKQKALRKKAKAEAKETKKLQKQKAKEEKEAAIKKEKAEQEELANQQRQREAAIAERRKLSASRDLTMLSDAELKRRVDRLNLEQRYMELANQLYPEKQSRVKQFLKVMGDATMKAASDIATEEMKGLMKTAIKAAKPQTNQGNPNKQNNPNNQNNPKQQSSGAVNIYIDKYRDVSSDSNDRVHVESSSKKKKGNK